MLRTIRTTTNPASELGSLLYKNPARSCFLRRAVTVSALLVCGPFAPAAEAQGTRGTDAFALAIQHFNGAHDRPMASEGPEHQFMLAALAAVDSAVPILRFSRKTGVDGETFRSLRTSAHRLYDTTASKIAHQAQLKSLAQEVGRGCLGDSVVSREYHIRAGITTATINDVVTHLFDAGGTGGHCLNPVIRSLLMHGMSYLRFLEQHYDNWASQYQLTLGADGGPLRDMNQVRKGMLADSATAWIARQFYPLPLDVDEMTPPWDIVLVGDSGWAGFDAPFVLRYSWRAGDCNPGCPERYAWIVEVRPQLNPQEAGPRPRWRFRVKVVREEGAPLPPEVRAQIQGEAEKRR
jgi:hypothetical protein